MQATITEGGTSAPISAARRLGSELRSRLRRVLGEAGLSRVRRATETPFNIVLEAKR